MTEYLARDVGQVDKLWRPFATNKAAELRERGRARMQAELDELGIELLPNVWDPTATLATSRWHEQRADGVEQLLTERLAGCGTKHAAIVTCRRRCAPKLAEVGCGAWKICKACRGKRQRRMFARTAEAMRAASEGWAARAGRAAWYMLTLTVRHSGNAAQDAETIRLGWSDFWDWFCEHHRRALLGKHPPHITAHEMTNGRDAQGHYHLHCAFLFPRAGGRRVNYGACHRAWKRITRRLGNPSCILDFRTAQTANGKGSKEHKPEAAAAYLAKHSVPSYVAKSDTGSDLSDENLAHWLASTYGRRVIHTSDGFWLRYSRVCPCCVEKLHMLVGHRGAILSTWEQWSAAPHADDG